jgi:hypothetical protein
MTGLIIGILNQWHNKLMIYSAVDLGVKIDFGPNKPGAILQHKDKSHWHDYLVKGESVVNPHKVESLPPGRYRLHDPA